MQGQERESKGDGGNIKRDKTLLKTSARTASEKGEHNLQGQSEGALNQRPCHQKVSSSRRTTLHPPEARASSHRRPEYIHG